MLKKDARKKGVFMISSVANITFIFQSNIERNKRGKLVVEIQKKTIII